MPTIGGKAVGNAPPIPTSQGGTMSPPPVTKPTFYDLTKEEWDTLRNSDYSAAMTLLAESFWDRVKPLTERHGALQPVIKDNIHVFVTAMEILCNCFMNEEYPEADEIDNLLQEVIKK